LALWRVGSISAWNRAGLETVLQRVDGKPPNLYGFRLVPLVWIVSIKAIQIGPGEHQLDRGLLFLKRVGAGSPALPLAA
jgi:hypothetical protein